MPRSIVFPTPCRSRATRACRDLSRRRRQSIRRFCADGEIPGAANGPLAGKRIVMKDCICVAGVPIMNGSATFEGYVPEIDATIVTRMLDAGRHDRWQSRQ